jgi:hypothetical protein
MSNPSISPSLKKANSEKVKKTKEKKPQTFAEMVQQRMSRLEKREQRLITAIENHKKNQKLCESKLDKVRIQKQAETKAIEELVAQYKTPPA